jgi:hypothetical protein
LTIEGILLQHVLEIMQSFSFVRSALGEDFVAALPDFISPSRVPELLSDYPHLSVTCPPERCGIYSFSGSVL